MAVMRRRAVGLPVLVVVALASCAREPSGGSLPPPDPKRSTLRLTSPAFADGAAIPRAHTCDGADASPPLDWSAAPEGARSLALVCEDPDAPAGTWTHWVMFDIPADARGLPAGVPTTERVPITPAGEPARQGKNDFGKIGYGGPCPPRGTHHYVFRLFALDDRPETGPDPTGPALARAIRGHVVAEGKLTGTYAR